MKWGILFGLSWLAILIDGFVMHLIWPSFIATATMVFSLLKFGEQSE